MTQQILQITPANGWEVIYRGTNGEEWGSPIACFALVEDERGERQVVGLGPCEYGLELVEDAANFVTYRRSPQEQATLITYRSDPWDADDIR